MHFSFIIFQLHFNFTKCIIFNLKTYPRYVVSLSSLSDSSIYMYMYMLCLDLATQARQKLLTTCLLWFSCSKSSNIIFLFSFQSNTFQMCFMFLHFDGIYHYLIMPIYAFLFVEREKVKNNLPLLELQSFPWILVRFPLSSVCMILREVHMAQSWLHQIHLWRYHSEGLHLVYDMDR